MTNFADLQTAVLEWGYNKGLLNPEFRFKQALKTFSEAGELADALIKQDQSALEDAIGDVVVTLIILADQCNTSVPHCLAKAYKEIKDRTGQTVDGTFIKD